jgi:anti-sigma28 factor (negative regulator of flagellin synthesis)
MRLQLDSSSIGPGSVGGTAPAEASGHSAPGARATTGGAQDSSAVSGTSALLNSLATERNSRIQQLTQSVQNGSYQVSSAAVSHAIVGHAVK